MFMPENESVMAIGGWSGLLPTTRADEVDTLFNLAAKYNIPFNLPLLYVELINLVYEKPINVKIELNVKGENENE